MGWILSIILLLAWSIFPSKNMYLLIAAAIFAVAGAISEHNNSAK